MSKQIPEPASVGLTLDLVAMTAHAEDAAKLLRALSNARRLMILCVLNEGELSVSELNDRVPLSQSALSQHLAVLRRDGLVDTRRASQTIYYRLRSGPVLRVLQALQDAYCAAPEPTTSKDEDK